MSHPNDHKPDISEIVTAEEFKKWYWLKEELVAYCKLLELPHTGKKFDLRDRIIFALENEGQLLKVSSTTKPKSRFNWAKEKLTLNTVITDNVSFGPNFRNFMKDQIGNRFSCHGDFMAWVKSNTGKTLHDAVDQWIELENRKLDPNFKREIAAYNMMNQYVRDFLADNSEKKFKDALLVWKVKKNLPAENGVVKYDKRDLNLIVSP
ncbi:MAG: DUF6434 domain-containing protein [Bacteroidota bacterium]